MGHKHFIAAAALLAVGLCSPCRAESASVLLEKGIHAEQTAGDIDAAIKIYEQVIADAEANRKFVAEALYRLGMCYTKKNEPARAREAFEKLIKQFPDQRDLVAKARKQIPTELELSPAPWADGEEMRLLLWTKTGLQVGMITYSAQLIPREPGAAAMPVGPAPGGATKDTHFWRIQSYMAVPINNLLQFTSVDADLNTFAPMFGRTKNTVLGDFKATYMPDKVKLEIDRKGKTDTQQVDVAGAVFDNEKVLYLIRRLPLKEGYEGSFQIFSVQSGSIVECRIRVQGKEKRTWTGGEMETYRVVLEIRSQGVTALQHTLWFSTDPHRWLVGYDAGTVDMRLLGVGKMSKEAETFKLAPDLSILRPAGWHYYTNPTPGEYKLFVQMLPPELKAWAGLWGAQVPAAITSPRALAEGDVQVLKGFFKGYAVRKDSWKELKVADLPAVSYLADYTDDGKDMVEYRTYLLAEGSTYWFVFRIEKDKFEAERKEFDSIVRSLRLPAAGTRVGPPFAERTEAERLCTEGWDLWRQRKLPEAEAKLKAAIEKDPSHANAWNGLGWAQFNQGKPLNAEESFQKCLALQADHAAALNGLGWIAKGRGNTKEAIEYWQKAVKALPTATAALSGLAGTYMELKEYDKAVVYYQMWLKAEPDSAEAKAGLEKAKAAGK